VTTATVEGIDTEAVGAGAGAGAEAETELEAGRAVVMIMMIVIKVKVVTQREKKRTDQNVVTRTTSHVAQRLAKKRRKAMCHTN
jgi:hypothetical protein